MSLEQRVKNLIVKYHLSKHQIPTLLAYHLVKRSLYLLSLVMSRGFQKNLIIC